MSCISNICRSAQSQSERINLNVLVESGLFEECASGLERAMGIGSELLCETATMAIYFALSIVRYVSTGQRGCEARLRSLASTLAFWLEHDLDCVQELGMTTGSNAAAICCSVFGRDEEDSEFSFTPAHIEMMLARWSQTVRGESIYVKTKPTDQTIMVVELCISVSALSMPA